MNCQFKTFSVYLLHIGESIYFLLPEVTSTFLASRVYEIVQGGALVSYVL